MARISSLVAALGFALALPLAASAGEPTDTKTEQVAAVSAGPVVNEVRAEKTEKRAERKDERRSSDVRGMRVGDPGVRFNNPYAFPVQSLPLALPNLTSFSF